MSGNNMSRMYSEAQMYSEAPTYSDEEEYVFEEEIYDDVYAYMEECDLRKIITNLERSREITINMTTYPDRFGNIEPNNLEEPIYVYIRSENLSFIANKKHVHFDQFGYPY
jgi:hypothetical protein